MILVNQGFQFQDEFKDLFCLNRLKPNKKSHKPFHFSVDFSILASYFAFDYDYI